MLHFFKYTFTEKKKKNAAEVKFFSRAIANLDANKDNQRMFHMTELC